MTRWAPCKQIGRYGLVFFTLILNKDMLQAQAPTAL